jgi:glycolate oxidase FAD binding subunit
VNVPVLKPQTESEIAEIVREAKGPFEIASHGTKRAFGRPVAAETILDVGALSGIMNYEPEELVLTACAATPMADIEMALSAKNQMLAFEPADWGPLFDAPEGQATPAGVVATNACGSRRVKAGAVRDSVIGCRFVNGSGEAIKAGGRVIKNVTGFDIAKLMAGAMGTLGAMTEITLRVVPKPERIAAIAIFCGGEDGLRLLREAAKLPVDATGLAYCPAPLMERLDAPCRGEGAALIRIEGSNPAVDQKIAVLAQWMAKCDSSRLDEDVAERVFNSAGRGGAFLGADADLWRLCVPPTEAQAAQMESGADDWYADWAGAMLWLGLPADDGTATRLRTITAKYGGHATLMRGSKEARKTLAVFEPESTARAELTRSVKAAFDPKHLFNPGRMFEGV